MCKNSNYTIIIIIIHWWLTVNFPFSFTSQSITLYSLQSLRKLTYLYYSQQDHCLSGSIVFNWLLLVSLYAFLQRATCTSQWSSTTTLPSRRTRWFCPVSWARPPPRSNGSKMVTKSFPPRTFSSNQTARSACWSSRRRQRATSERTRATVAPTKPQPTWTSKVIPAAIQLLPQTPVRTAESGPSHRCSPKPRLSLGRCSPPLHPSFLCPVLSFWMFVMFVTYYHDTWG